MYLFKVKVKVSKLFNFIIENDFDEKYYLFSVTISRHLYVIFIMSKKKNDFVLIVLVN